MDQRQIGFHFSPRDSEIADFLLPYNPALHNHIPLRDAANEDPWVTCPTDDPQFPERTWYYYQMLYSKSGGVQTNRMTPSGNWRTCGSLGTIIGSSGVEVTYRYLTWFPSGSRVRTQWHQVQYTIEGDDSNIVFTKTTSGMPMNWSTVRKPVKCLSKRKNFENDGELSTTDVTSSSQPIESCPSIKQLAVVLSNLQRLIPPEHRLP